VLIIGIAATWVESAGADAAGESVRRIGGAGAGGVTQPERYGVGPSSSATISTSMRASLTNSRDTSTVVLVGLGNGR
jgi:hypothetical protein